MEKVTYPAVTRSGKRGRRGHLRAMFKSLHYFRKEASVHGYLNRLNSRSGEWVTDAEKIWEENPVVHCSHDPNDFASSDVTDVVAFVRRLATRESSLALGERDSRVLNALIGEARGLCLVLHECPVQEERIGDALRLIGELGMNRTLDGDWVDSNGRMVPPPAGEEFVPGSYEVVLENDDAYERYTDVVLDSRTFVQPHLCPPPSPL